ncbi:MAG: hypothetical protein QGG64_23095, partial [Candidatus Latescibacteria bacterium]|nr:hypothetical protein [Candidatus Latescibacterota bacterium]
MPEEEVLPTWAPRVAKRKIKQLYDDDARGMHDEELIEDVGYSLLSRCDSFIVANEARDGSVRCPCCEASVSHKSGEDEILKCQNCDWRLSWAAYFKTIQHKQLSGGEDVMEPFRDFIRAFPRARTLREKMIHIDQLIHGFHGYIKKMDVRRPVAVNLIEGRLKDVVLFLEQLSSTTYQTPGLSETYK